MGSYLLVKETLVPSAKHGQVLLVLSYFDGTATTGTTATTTRGADEAGEAELPKVQQ